MQNLRRPSSEKADKLQLSFTSLPHHKVSRDVFRLEPVCCKKQQKKVPDQLLLCGIGAGITEDSEWYKINP